MRFIMMIMRYTWDKRFDDSEDPFTFSEKFKHNLFVFKGNLKFIRERVGYFITELNDKVSSILYKWRVFIFPIVVKIIVLKLKMKGKKDITIEKSPYSESTYIDYMYDGLFKNYIRIRVSMHANPNAKADIYVWV